MTSVLIKVTDKDASSIKDLINELEKQGLGEYFLLDSESPELKELIKISSESTPISKKTESNGIDNVSVVIPTLNEAASIEELIREFQALGVGEILVVDGHSTDGTAEIAKRNGVKVIEQSGKGKGLAVIDGFRAASKDYVVLIDGDSTYPPEELPKLLEPVQSGKADHVIGNRFTGYAQDGAFTRLNAVGNKILNKMFGMMYGEWLTDILSGYRVFHKNSLKKLDLRTNKFEIETEMTVESIKKGLRIVEVPINYRSRKESDPTKLNPFKDGFKIGYTIYRLTKTHNPFWYFGLIGICLILLGVFVGSFVVLGWAKTGLMTTPGRLMLSVLSTIIGSLFLIFGLLADLMVLLHREMMRSIHK